MVHLDPDKKIAGILVPVFALRGTSDLGIGDTEALKEMIAWAAKHQFGTVQILPVNETGGDSSPYNLLSAIALEPSTIATIPEVLPDLTKRRFETITARHDFATLQNGPVNYPRVKALKQELLLAAYDNFVSAKASPERHTAFRTFQHEQSDWLEDYSFYRALITWNKTEAADTWPAEHQTPRKARKWLKELSEKKHTQFNYWRNFYAYVQWIAHDQWQKVHDFADMEGVALMGDIPVGVARFSSDTWSQPDIFDLDRSCGAPPEKVFKTDPFTEKWGQNWGFPLYDWDRMAKDDYAWWRRRFRSLMRVFHLVRVDHALGFFRIYSFPWRPEQNALFTDLTPEQAVEITKGPLPGFIERDDSSDVNREFNRLHGDKILKIFLEESGPHRLIAEDLGEVAPYVRPTLKKLEIPGFKIPQWERVWDRLIPGKDYERLSLATFATHDHPPIMTFWNELFAQSKSEDKAVQEHAIHTMWEFMDFCGAPDTKLPQAYNPEIHALFLHGLFASNAWLAVHMITDLMGTNERFNVPGLAGDLNWTQRLSLPVAEWNTQWAEPLKVAAEAIKATERGLN